MKESMKLELNKIINSIIFEDICNKKLDIYKVIASKYFDIEYLEVSTKQREWIKKTIRLNSNQLINFEYDGGI